MAQLLANLHIFKLHANRFKGLGIQISENNAGSIVVAAEQRLPSTSIITTLDGRLHAAGRCKVDFLFDNAPIRTFSKQSQIDCGVIITGRFPVLDDSIH